MEDLILASASPRRKELISSIGISFLAIDPDIDERGRDHLVPADRVIALAEDKAMAVARRIQIAAPRFVLGADTLVCAFDQSGVEETMGKPEGRDDARRMLAALSGKTHLVRTGLAVIDRESGKTHSIRSDSSVRFASLSETELERYLDSGEWEGAAGAYRIQGLAALYIERIEGSWSGIVGLPLHELYGILRGAGFRFADGIREGSLQGIARGA